MSNIAALTKLVDEYVAADMAEKAAKTKKDAIKAKLKEHGLKEFEGTHAKLTFTETERVTLDPVAVKAVLSNPQFLAVVSVSNEKFSTALENMFPNDEQSVHNIWKQCVSKVSRIPTVRIGVLANA